MIYIGTTTVHKIHIVTAHITSLGPLYYSNSYVLMISTVTATITALYSILLQHLLRPYDLYCYSIYYVTKTFILQQLLRPYDLYCYSNYYIPMI